jgi:hypothetical protein
MVSETPTTHNQQKNKINIDYETKKMNQAQQEALNIHQAT